ncbi:MAG TPA: polyphosphate kinase 1 [Longimicrobiales bacterium]|nr:polyphosphate kinase 1 [Longimicrobiales bacterium]
MTRPATERTVLRFQVPDRDTLERLVDAPLAGSGVDDAIDVAAFRDVYFDTPAADLKAKGATLSIRQRQDGTATLRLDVLERVPEDGVPRRRTAEASVPSADRSALLGSDAEPVRLLRALIDPERLESVLEVETLRRTRRAMTETGDAVYLHCHIATVRHGDLTGELFELEVDVPNPTSHAVNTLLSELRQKHALRPSLAEIEGRARELAEAMVRDALEQGVRASREVAVLVHDNGALGLMRRGNELVVPYGPGAGAQACRQALRSAFGHARARVRLLGTSSGTPGRPALQIWLAEDVERPEQAQEITWVPIEQALDRAGAPGLRDSRTLRALNLVARAGLGTWGLAALRVRDPEHDTLQPLELVLQQLEAADGTVEPSPRDVPPDTLLNAELSRMSFDERILVMAEDSRVPLLERVRFLGMFGQRRDDFFMTRVARFKRMLAARDADRTMDGLTPSEQLDVISIRARRMKQRAYTLLFQRLLPELEERGIVIHSWDELAADDQDYVRATYGDRLEALVVPLVADPMHPFPHVRNLRPALAATVRLPGEQRDQLIAVELPGDLPRFVPLPGGRRFVPLEDVIRAALPELYPGLEVVRAHTFRVTRSATIDLGDDPFDMLETVAEEVARRPFQEVVRLEVERSMPPEMREHLLREMQFEREEYASTLDEQDVYSVERFVDLAALEELAQIEQPELHWEPRQVRTPFPAERSIFEQIAERDLFVHFPHDSFSDSVERLLEEAADDPQVVAVKITLYRTGSDSAIVAALERARRNGKDAVAMVELKASFDEQRNIAWARSLEEAGIRVVFSPPKYKVHAKVALVLRREDNAVRRYAYIGTGNLNARTAASYVDVGILTADQELTQEVNSIFNLLTGYAANAEVDRLLVSPFNMRRRFLRMIDREIEHARAGRAGRIRIQMNGLMDRRLIAALYHASQAGVQIDMMVREICSLRPGVPGLSENIRVTSLLGRYLQHARIYHFHNDGSDEYYIGSADWRPRNMRERVEIVTPVRDAEHCARLDHILDETLNHPETWTLRSDGAYVRRNEVIAAQTADDASVRAAAGTTR